MTFFMRRASAISSLVGVFPISRCWSATDHGAELKNRGFTLAFARVRDSVRDDMRLAGIEAIVGPRNFYERITDGVRARQL
jgi:hypothetical protein